MKKSVAGVLIVFLLMPIGGMVGCAPRVGGADYAGAETRQAQSVTYGTVLSVRTVHIEDDSNTAMGAAAGGAAVGGVLGSLVGHNRGKVLATVGGALAGGAIGSGGAKAMTNQTGLEIMVRLDGGETISVVQGADFAFSEGQRVKVLRGGKTRVSPL